MYDSPTGFRLGYATAPYNFVLINRVSEGSISFTHCHMSGNVGSLSIN